MTYPSIHSRPFPDVPLLSFRSVSRHLLTQCESQILSRFPGTKTTVSAVKLPPSISPSAPLPPVSDGQRSFWSSAVCLRTACKQHEAAVATSFGFCVHFEHGTNARVRALHTLFVAADNVLLIFPFPPPSVCLCVYTE